MDFGFGMMPSEKERSAQRLSLIRRMQGMNSMMAAERETNTRGGMGHSMTSHPAPVEDLSHRGIIKVSYDLGYATQTKSLLVEGHTTAKAVVEQLFEQLRLGGAAIDYCLEERNHMSGESRFLKKQECPLSNQMKYGPAETYIELWLVKARDLGNLREISGGGNKSNRTSAVFNGSDESLEQAGRVVSPKEEVSDHGIARLEGVLEEALQDLPSLVHEIQERLRVLSDSVADEEGQPKAGLPPRRMLWDQLKPQAAQLVREIRRLVDNCEFLASRHCPSAVCQKIVTLLVELITDHSRELVSVTKEMCALRGAASTEFDSSVTSFANQIVIISNLIGKSHSAIRVAAVSAHLLEAIAIDHLQEDQMQISGGVCFTGSKAVSGILLFAEASAFLGLIRAGYDNKRDYFAKLAANVLRTANWAMNTVRETTEYSLLHLHPLRSRVHDMEQKLKVSMDSLVIAVRKASDYHSSPDAVPEMLLAAHMVIMATLDYLVVAQCASLLHQVFIPEEDVLHMPWVQGVLATKTSTALGSSSEGQGSSHSSKPPSMQTTSLSSVSTSTDTASSTGTSEAPSSRHSPVSRRGNRQSRAGVPSPGKIGDPDMIDESSELAINFSKLGMGASRLQLTGEMLSEENPAASSYDEVSQYLSTDFTSPNDVWSSSSGKKKKRPKKQKSRPKLDSDVVDSSSPHKGSSEGVDYEGRADGTQHRLSHVESPSVSEDSEGGGSIEAIQRIRRNYLTNRAIARVAEALHLTVTRKISVLQSMIKEGNRDKCLHEVELVVAAAKQIREELSVVDIDILVGQRLANSIEKSYPLLEAAIRDVMFASMIAFSNSAPEGTHMKLLATMKVLQDISTKMVGEALKVASEHKKALEQAEELEKEYFGLMTGQKHKYKLGNSMESEGSHAKRIQSPARMAANESEAEKVLFEERSPGTFMPGTKSWSARAAPLVIGGTVKQLVDRLVYTRSVDIEFHRVFLLTFRSFSSPLQLMDALLKRYHVKTPEGLSPGDEEAFEGEVAIPTRLRVVSAVRTWIQTSYDDFRSKEMQQRLKTLCDVMDSSMPACAKQLLALLKENMEEGAVHLRQKPRQQAPPPIVPQALSLGKDLRITDINSLELSRQLTIICSQKFRDIRCHDMVVLPQNETETARYITEMQRFSDKLSRWVEETISSQTEVDEQVSLLGYFIQTANNCHDLKNFEGLFALMRGLKENCHEGTDGWLSVSSQLVSVYYNLCEVASADMDYLRYRQELRMVNQSSCVPILSVVLEDVARVARDYSDTVPGAQGSRVINFQKYRMFSHIFSSIIKYQSMPYALLPVEPIQAFFSTLPEPTTEQTDQTLVQ